MGAERYFALDWEPRPRVSYRFLPFEIDILRGTEITSERDTIEEFTDFALVDWNVVKQGEEQGEETHNEDCAHPD